VESLWTKLTVELAEDLLNKACFSYKVDNGEHFLVNRTAVRDMLHIFIEENLESYEFKKRS
jgi:hypothetical protein